MGSARWHKIEALYFEALAREPGERPAFLRQACGDDVELRREVESLLAYDARAEGFIEAPALEVAAKQLAQEQADLPLRRRASGYKILSLIGAGGMGEVYLAEDLRLERRVAIKFLPLLAGDNPQAKKRFLREARLAAQLDHPNICTIHEVREEDGVSFLVMPYVEGETLADCIRREPLALGDALDLAVQIADALAEAHRHDIIHRDVKPQNIIINSRRQVKVLDFGLAKMVKTGLPAEGEANIQSIISTPGMVVGTAPYMSPEQVRGEDLDARTDIFSFGAVLYEMLSGRSPFAAPSRLESLVAITEENPPPLALDAGKVPDELQRIVSKALRKKPDERYRTMKDLLLDLQALREERGREAMTESPSPPDADLTGDTATPPTSGLDDALGKIKTHKLAALLVAGTVLAAALLALWLFAPGR